jgi:hypothetical protein
LFVRKTKNQKKNINPKRNDTGMALEGEMIVPLHRILSQFQFNDHWPELFAWSFASKTDRQTEPANLLLPKK